MASRFEALRSDDLLRLICDPQLRPVAELIETSAWEASLCPVQRTDVRNFAHGRHSWLHHHPDRSMVLGLVGKDGLPLWHAVAARLPDIRVETLMQADGGRYSNAVGIVQGLVLVEAIGKAEIGRAHV